MVGMFSHNCIVWYCTHVSGLGYQNVHQDLVVWAHCSGRQIIGASLHSFAKNDSMFVSIAVHKDNRILRRTAQMQLT